MKTKLLTICLLLVTSQVFAWTEGEKNYIIVGVLSMKLTGLTRSSTDIVHAILNLWLKDLQC